MGRAELLARPGLVGSALRSALSDLYDGWLAARLGGWPGVALVAVGGLGRREPAPHSDLDLVLLHVGRGEVSELADALWYPIWDAGLGLDHSVRTVPEAMTVARSDLKAALGLLDLRHLAGDPALTGLLRESVLADWRSAARRRLPELRAAGQARWSAHGELAFLLEPDLKAARGGLRDVHALHALAAAQRVDLPGAAVRAAAELLLDVRGELHRRTGRALDRLVQQEQDGVAGALGYRGADELLRAVSEAGRTVAFACDSAWRQVAAELAASGRGVLSAGRGRPPGRALPARLGLPAGLARSAGRALPAGWGRAAARGLVSTGPATERRPLAEGVVEQDGEVVLARDADPWADPVLLLRAANAAARAGLPLAPHALDRLATESALLPMPWPDAALDTFVDLLGAGSAAVPVLESLDQVGLLVRVVPEWEAVRFRPQRDPVHRFTVDRHLVETAANAAELTRTVARPDLLLLGALLHDIGKGFTEQHADHTEAGVEVVGRLAPRLGLSDADCAVLVALVRHHLLLPDTATRRDLDDPVTVQSVVAAVGGSAELLHLLHALSIADGRATGPAAWTDWKAELVAELVRRAAQTMAGGVPPARPEPSADQLRLAGAGRLAVRLDGELVTVVAPDSPGLLGRVTGVLALHHLTVRAATIMTVPVPVEPPLGRPAMAVNVFTVAPRFGRLPDPALLRADVARAVTGTLPLGELLAAKEQSYRRVGPAEVAPPQVRWLDHAATAATVLELRAADALGLLHRVTAALERCGLDVRCARVSTWGGAAVDALYLVGPDGGPVPHGRLRDAASAAVLSAAGG